MSKSLTYHLTLFVLKLKGVKKVFSKDPIDVNKVRKDDVHSPKGTFFKKNSRVFNISDTSITEFNQTENFDKLILFVHGGAFISGPTKFHWDTVQEIAQQTSQAVWMCDYPKAPENSIHEISKNIDAVYQAALEKYEANKISIVGDSVGGTLITALVQRLITTKNKIPRRIILVSPVMDSTMSNPEIDEVDKLDPMLSKSGVLSAKKMCARNTDLSDPIISPINGSFDGFPSTLIFLAKHDITYPDQQLAVQKIRKAKVKIDIIEGENMPHIWPFLPVMKEAKTALNQIIDRLKK
jgi:acetyl esterase/lipase